MDVPYRPIVTFYGDQSVYQAVQPSLLKGIGSEAVEWKRAYGRTTKLVHLHPKFIPLEPSAVLSGNGVEGGDSGQLTSLLDQSMLHVFWTECQDVDIYRSTTKDLIQAWLNIVKGCNVKEWLIVLVETPDNKKTKQLLPRSSVLDKIKNDFAQKQTERCICLADPTKLDSKSAESLQAMLHRIRQLLLASYSKTLTKFEENMRAQREKRNEPGWNFCHYFLLQEELAFVLEMLEVYDEALVQYDELDALFTQFVLNSHLTDTPKWLLSFQRYGDRWPALNLSSSYSDAVLAYIRETIQKSSVSLLNFRNYLFARQARLLVKQSRLNELAQRSLSFLHNCINELNILDVTFSEEGAISCWVFVSCLEILSVLCGRDSGQVPDQSGNQAIVQKGESTKSPQQPADHVHHLMPVGDFSVHAASLWDYAREKLYELGKLVGLLPKCQPKSDHLHKVISLAAGLGCLDCDLDGNSKADGAVDLHKIGPAEESKDSPIVKLKNALASKEQFEQYYLELCELAMGTYKHIGRIRSARKVGLSLANHYMDAGDYSKATSFLVDALKTFNEDKWSMLALDVMLKLATCYKVTLDLDKYIRTCMLLSCNESLPQDRRNMFYDEMLSALSSSKFEQPLTASMKELCSIAKVQIETPGKIDNGCCPVTINVEVNCKLPKELPVDFLQAAIVKCDPGEHISLLPTVVGNTMMNLGQIASNMPTRSSGAGMGLVKKPSFEHKGNSRSSPGPPVQKAVVIPGSCEEEDMNLTLAEAPNSMMKLDMRQYIEVKQDKSVSGGRLLCQNTHQALRRKESSQLKPNESSAEKSDFSVSGKVENILLQPGKNEFTLKAELKEPGMYRIAQIMFGFQSMHIMSMKLGCRHKFEIQSVPGKIQVLSQSENASLIAGIEQKVQLEVFTGSKSIQDGMNIHIRSSLGLLVKIGPDSPLKPEIAIPVKVCQSFSTFTVELTLKADLGPQKDTSTIEHKLIAKCPWSTEETKLHVLFVPPFMSSHKLHTVGLRKFIQVSMHGLCDHNFTLSSHQLSIQQELSESTPLIPLNPRSQELVLHNGHSASYMWELGTTESSDDEVAVRLEFSVAFRRSLPNSTSTVKDSPSPAVDSAVEVYKYYICLQRYLTNYSIIARVEPHKGSEFCRVGNMCSMVIDIEKHKNCKAQALTLMYEVRADQHMWAICGRTSGVTSFDGTATQQMIIDVMPMSPGFLPLPTVHLSKYIPADAKANAAVPKLEPFSTGQVFNKTRGIQVHVLPPPHAPGAPMSITASSAGSTNNSFFALGPASISEHH